MRKNVSRSWLYLFAIPLAFAGALMLSGEAAACGVQPADTPAHAQLSFTATNGCEHGVVPADTAGESAPLPSDGTAAAGSAKCCDPTREPGVGGNPFCFEGHTCCADGQWRCNNADATPSCPSGQVCGSTCGLSGAACNSGADCCSGQCRGNHKCR